MHTCLYIFMVYIIPYGIYYNYYEGKKESLLILSVFIYIWRDYDSETIGSMLYIFHVHEFHYFP